MEIVVIEQYNTAKVIADLDWDKIIGIVNQK